MSKSGALRSPSGSGAGLVGRRNTCHGRAACVVVRSAPGAGAPRLARALERWLCRPDGRFPERVRTALREGKYAAAIAAVLWVVRCVAGARGITRFVQRAPASGAVFACGLTRASGRAHVRFRDRGAPHLDHRSAAHDGVHRPGRDPEGENSRGGAWPGGACVDDCGHSAVPCRPSRGRVALLPLVGAAPQWLQMVRGLQQLQAASRVALPRCVLGYDHH